MQAAAVGLIRQRAPDSISEMAAGDRLVARSGNEIAPAFLIMAAAAVAFFAILRFRETYHIPLVGGSSSVGQSLCMTVHAAAVLFSLMRLAASLWPPIRPIAKGRRIGDGGRGRPITAASCCFSASISAASSMVPNSSARLLTMPLTWLASSGVSRPSATLVRRSLSTSAQLGPS